MSIEDFPIQQYDQVAQNVEVIISLYITNCHTAQYNQPHYIGSSLERISRQSHGSAKVRWTESTIIQNLSI